MALNKQLLTQMIKRAIEDAQTANSIEEGNFKLAAKLADAIDTYVRLATVNPGQTVTVPFAPSPLIGVTTTPGTLS